MREVVFLKSNEKRWRQTEAIIEGKVRTSPDDLAKLFIQLSDDLAYAQTNYKDSPTTEYLNRMTVQLYRIIHKNKKFHFNRLFSFWKYELPLEFRRSHKQFLLSFIIFGVFTLIGLVSVHYDQNFAKVVLGEEYTKMTEKNISNDDPMAVYKKGEGEADLLDQEIFMFVRIALNNIRVSIYTFISGAFFGLGSIYLLFKNGVMLGAFQWFFYTKGLLFSSFLTIWIHGAIEISCIIIAGAAGLVIGSGFLYPGTFSRVDSFVNHAKRGVKIMVGIIPLIILAAVLEGFVTRHTEWHWIAKLSIILSSFTFVLFYFVFYPIWLERKGYYLESNLDNSFTAKKTIRT
jgi:uncharacterized membrane protein SpoIIM required for sporulation